MHANHDLVVGHPALAAVTLDHSDDNRPALAQLVRQVLEPAADHERVEALLAQQRAQLAGAPSVRGGERIARVELGDRRRRRPVRQHHRRRRGTAVGVGALADQRHVLDDQPAGIGGDLRGDSRGEIARAVPA